MSPASQISCVGEHNWPWALSSCWAIQQHACVKAMLAMDCSLPVMEGASNTDSGIFPGDLGLLWWLVLAPELPDGFVETSLHYTAARTRLPSLPPLPLAQSHTAPWAGGSSRLAGILHMLSFFFLLYNIVVVFACFLIGISLIRILACLHMLGICFLENLD